MLAKYNIISISVTKSGTDITLHSILLNRCVTVPAINPITANLIIAALRNNIESQLQVLGKWVIKIHNKKHYKVFCLCFIDPDFGLQYIPGYTPLEMVMYQIANQ